MINWSDVTAEQVRAGGRKIDEIHTLFGSTYSAYRYRGHRYGDQRWPGGLGASGDGTRAGEIKKGGNKLMAAKVRADLIEICDRVNQVI